MKHTTLIPSRFPLGKIAATPGALEKLGASEFTALDLLNRHASGDWGDLCGADKAENEHAVPRHLRILSSYRLVDAAQIEATPQDERSNLPTIWVITEADRSVTTLLCPNEY